MAQLAIFSMHFPQYLKCPHGAQACVLSFFRQMQQRVFALGDWRAFALSSMYSRSLCVVVRSVRMLRMALFTSWCRCATW